MIWYITAGIISLVFLWGTTCEYIKTIKGKIKAAKENRHYYMGDDDWTFFQWFFLNIALAVIILAVAWFLNTMSGCIIWSEFPETHQYYEEVDFEVAAFKDNIATQGRTYLTRGYFEDNLYYFYLRDTSMGLKQGKMRADHTYINYTDEKPHIEYYEERYRDDVGWVKWFTTKEQSGGGYYYKAYVPVGTVEEEFRVDLE